ncbi:MAG: hypothetical protein QOF00_1253 [Pseudonocardiales bacterium]|jgi:hypothetical protein|nr:hypothetical protein [Pseudonocardiales bacterium]
MRGNHPVHPARRPGGRGLGGHPPHPRRPARPGGPADAAGAVRRARPLPADQGLEDPPARTRPGRPPGPGAAAGRVLRRAAPLRAREPAGRGDQRARPRAGPHPAAVEGEPARRGAPARRAPPRRAPGTPPGHRRAELAGRRRHHRRAGVPQDQPGQPGPGPRPAPGSINDLVQAAIGRAGLQGGPFSAHSLRAGFVTFAHLRGASDRAIAHQTRHRSLATRGAYVRMETAWQDNAATQLGL